MCNCNPNITEAERYVQQIVVEPPFPEYVQRRKDAGLSGKACIDPCIMAEIQSLWDAGILTHGCCCGHNSADAKCFPFVNVADEHIEEMLALGYVQEHWDATRKDTFRLKSV
jgi:hypothetical protein